MNFWRIDEDLFAANAITSVAKKERGRGECEGSYEVTFPDGTRRRAPHANFCSVLPNNNTNLVSIVVAGWFDNPETQEGFGTKTFELPIVGWQCDVDGEGNPTIGTAPIVVGARSYLCVFEGVLNLVTGRVIDPYGDDGPWASKEAFEEAAKDGLRSSLCIQRERELQAANKKTPMNTIDTHHQK